MRCIMNTIRSHRPGLAVIEDRWRVPEVFIAHSPWCEH